MIAMGAIKGPNQPRSSPLLTSGVVGRGARPTVCCCLPPVVLCALSVCVCVWVPRPLRPLAPPGRGPFNRSRLSSLPRPFSTPPHHPLAAGANEVETIASTSPPPLKSSASDDAVIVLFQRWGWKTPPCWTYCPLCQALSAAVTAVATLWRRRFVPDTWR